MRLGDFKGLLFREACGFPSPVASNSELAAPAAERIDNNRAINHAA